MPGNKLAQFQPRHSYRLQTQQLHSIQGDFSLVSIESQPLFNRTIGRIWWLPSPWREIDNDGLALTTGWLVETCSGSVGSKPTISAVSIRSPFTHKLIKASYLVGLAGPVSYEQIVASTFLTMIWCVGDWQPGVQRWWLFREAGRGPKTVEIKA